MVRLKAAFAALAILATAACSPNPADTAKPATAAAVPAIHPESGLPVVSLTAWPGGQPHVFRVEVARTSAEQSKGLMFRRAMGADEGMIFPMNPSRLVAFWMRNTVIPLDIIFVGKDNRIVNIAADAVPYSETALPSMAPVIGVLELNGGRAAELGLKAGDRVEW